MGSESPLLDRISELSKKVEPYLEKYLAHATYPELKEAMLYQVRTGGKRIRPVLVMLSAEAAGGKAEDALPAAAAYEIAHNTTLLFDDIIDKGEVRRGSPTMRIQYGEVTSLFTCFRYREAMERALKDSRNSARLSQLMSKVIDNVLEGGMLDLLLEARARDEPFLKEHHKNGVTMGEYLLMVKKKTSSLFEGCARSGAIVADASTEVEDALGDYGVNVGCLFQATDDILDIFGDEQELGKKIGKDLASHKLGNIVVVLALQKLDPTSRRLLLSALSAEELSESRIAATIKMLKDAGLQEDATEAASKFEEETQASLESLPDSEAKEILAVLPGLLLHRRA
jgi:geranylgeranyl diphosphate synthase type I